MKLSCRFFTPLLKYIYLYILVDYGTNCYKKTKSGKMEILVHCIYNIIMKYLMPSFYFVMSVPICILSGLGGVALYFSMTTFLSLVSFSLLFFLNLFVFFLIIFYNPLSLHLVGRSSIQGWCWYIPILLCFEIPVDHGSAQLIYIKIHKVNKERENKYILSKCCYIYINSKTYVCVGL